MKRKSQIYQAIWTALLCFDAGIISAFITKNDYLLLLIPVLLATALWIPLYRKNRFTNKWIGYFILLLSLFFTMGIVVYIAYEQIDFSLSKIGFTLLCVASGLLVYLWNTIVFTYKHIILSLTILILSMAAVPTIADMLMHINFIKRFISYPYLIVILWQTCIGFVLGYSVSNSKIIIDDAKKLL